jgi:hypothetical protein
VADTLNDKTIFFYSALLVCNGILVGTNIDFNNNTFYLVFSLVAVIGTVIAAFVGFPVFKQLEVVAFSCIDAVEKYMDVQYKLHYGKEALFYDEHKSACDDLLITICNKKEKFRVDVDFAQSLLSNKELAHFFYSHVEFEAEIYKLLRNIKNTYQIEGESRCQQLCQVEADIAGLKLDIKESFVILLFNIFTVTSTSHASRSAHYAHWGKIIDRLIIERCKCHRIVSL